MNKEEKRVIREFFIALDCNIESLLIKDYPAVGAKDKTVFVNLQYINEELEELKELILNQIV